MGDLCRWSQETADFDNVVYRTSCDNMFEFLEGDIEDNGFKFCPYCGEKIYEQPDE